MLDKAALLSSVRRGPDILFKLREAENAERARDFTRGPFFRMSAEKALFIVTCYARRKKKAFATPTAGRILRFFSSKFCTVIGHGRLWRRF
jgi:hypothetical protein